MEDEGTTSAGDMGVFTPTLGGAGTPEKRKMKTEKGKKVSDDSKSLSKAEKEGVKKMFADKGKTKLSEDIKKDSNMIEETTKYKYYNDGDRKVFEIMERADFDMFYQGLRKKNNRIWRQGETCTKMLQIMNENRGLWFEVRFGDRMYKPFDKGF